MFFKSKLFKQYFFKIFICFSIPCAILCTIIYLIYTTHYNYVITSVSDNTIANIEQLTNNLFDEIDLKYDIIARDQTIKNGMFLDTDSFYLPENYSFPQAVHSMLSYSVGSTNTISSIYLYSQNNAYVYSVDNSGKTNSNFLDKFLDLSWYEIYTSNPAHKIISSRQHDATQREVFSVIYEMDHNNIFSGLLIFNIEPATLKKLLTTNTENCYSNILIQDNNGKNIFSTFPDDFSYSFSKPNNYYGDNSIYYPTTLKSSKMNMLIAVSFYNNMDMLQKGTLLLGIALLLIILPTFVALLLANNFYSSIIQIAAYVQKFDANEVSTPNKASTPNELEYIYTNLKNALEHSHNMEYAIAQNIAELRNSQLISLQTQLNPHFLFNTLNTLTLMNATETDKDCFELLIRNLSNLLSYCLQTTNNLVSLKDELEYMNYYIEIEEIKYHVKIHVNCDIPQYLYETNVPKFIFQPVVENTLKHGFKYRFTTEPQIQIHTSIRNHFLYINFSDNGMGMDEAQLLALNQKMRSGIFPENNNIGLLNITKRIQLLYGKDYGCTVLTQPDFGFTLSIILPAPQNKTVNKDFL